MFRGPESFAVNPPLYTQGCLIPEPSRNPTLLHIERQASPKTFCSSHASDQSYVVRLNNSYLPNEFKNKTAILPII